MDAVVILVLSGPPGAGKTTAARLVADRLPRSVHLVADAFWHHIRGGYVQPWLATAKRQNEVVVEAVSASAWEFAAGGYDVVVDGVVGPWLFDPFVRRAGARIPLHYVVLRPDEATVLARAATRGSDGLAEGEALRHMYAEFRDLGSYERHVVDTTGMSVEQTVDRVFGLLAGDSHRAREA